MSDQFQQYFMKLTLCMMTYQFIEFGLRYCLHRCHATVKFRLHEYLPYQPSIAAVEDAALGRLVDWYKSYTDNEALIREIRVIKADRDRIAHQGYVLTIEEQADDEFLLAETRKLEVAHTKAEECLERLRAEMEKTDAVVNRAYSELRAKATAQGQSLPETRNVQSIIGESSKNVL